MKTDAAQYELHEGPSKNGEHFTEYEYMVGFPCVYLVYAIDRQ